jgi:hypothetical protein
MADDEILRQIARYFADSDKRERDAAAQNKAVVDAITKGFESLVKELHEGITLIQHTIIDELRR